MTAWQQLGIEPTTNLREIKKAYALKLKKIDQDTQPDQFISLREALQIAQSEAEYRLFDQKENQDSIFSGDQITNYSIEQNESTQENEINESPNTSLEELYLTIQQRIIDQDIHFNIRNALSEFAYYLDLVKEQTTRISYIERMDDLLRKYNLDDFLEYLEEFYRGDSTASDQINTLSDPSEMVFDVSDEQINPIIEELYKVRQLLWEDNISDEVFERFRLLLNQQFDLQLGQQIEIKDQLMNAIGELRVDSMSPKYFRFLELWNHIYPEDVHEYNEHHYSHVLQQQLHEYLHKRDLFRLLSNGNYCIFEQLSGTQKFHPLNMLHLQKQIKRYHPNQQVIDVVDQFEIKNTAWNINYNFLKSINKIKYFILMNLVLSLTTFSIFDQFLSTLLMQKSLILILIGIFIIFTLIIQPMIHAKILAFPNRDHILYLCQKSWFSTGFLMCIAASFLPTILYSLLSYLWLISTVILLGCLKLDAHKNMNHIFQSAYIRFDYFMMALGIAIFCLGFSIGFYTLGQPHQPWLISYSLIPISCLLFPNSFRPLFYTFGFWKNKNDLTEQQIIRRTASIILFQMVFVGSVTYFLIPEDSKDYIYAALLIFVGLFFTIFDTKKISSSIKYITYVIIILLFPYFNLLSIITGSYLYKSLKIKKQLSES